MNRFMWLVIACLLSMPASAEIVRGGMDCIITHQLYHEVNRQGLKTSDVMPRGDKIGAKLRLRYEFDRATPSLPWRLKTEFGRSAIYFDAKFPPASLALLQEEDHNIGFSARSLSQEVIASFTPEKITLSTDDSTAIFIHNGSQKWSGLYTESRSKSGADKSYFGLMMGFDCHHQTDAIERLTSLIK